MSSDFQRYVSPLPQRAFTQEHFSTLSVQQALDLSYPSIAPEGSVTSTELLNDVPCSGSATVIMHGEVIPHYKDLLPITSIMEDAFKAGMRSARVEFTFNGMKYSRLYHFSKIQLIRYCSNHWPAVQAYHRLVYHLETCPEFENRVALLSMLKQSPFTAKIRGFLVTECPLWKLECLLGERWLVEDIYNALLELCYFSQSSKELSAETLLLPTSFLTDACHAYSLFPRAYTPQILAFRHRVSNISVQSAAFSLVTDNHFTAYIFQRNSSTIKYGDSMHQTPPSYMLPILQWIFEGLFNVTSIVPGAIGMQGPGNGEGSCGVAAYNFIQTSTGIERNMRKWSGNQAALFQKAALEDLLRYHQIANERDGTIDGWTRRINGVDILDDTAIQEMPFPYGYRDFNLYVPLDKHPIREFLQIQTSLHMRIRESARPCLPLVNYLPTVSLDDNAALKGVALLPPFELIPPATAVSAPIKLPSMVQPSSPLVPKKRRHSHGDSRQPIIISSPFSITSASPLSVIDLTNSSPPVNITMKVQPPVNNFKCDSDNESIIEIYHTRKREPSIEWVPKREPSIQFVSSQDIKEPSPSQKCDSSVEFVPSSRDIRSVKAADGIVYEGAVFSSLEEAKHAIYAREAALGYQWKTAQSWKDAQKEPRKYMYRCNRYYRHIPRHSKYIDPAEHRRGKSIKTDCHAAVSVIRIKSTSLWKIGTVDWKHNHGRTIPEGASAHCKVTEKQKKIIQNLATTTQQTFTRGQIAAVLKSQIDDEPVPMPRQIGNYMNEARRKAREEVNSLGGDLHAILETLGVKSANEPGWTYHVKYDGQLNTITGLWWQSPLQGELCRRYSDVLINDNTYNRSNTGFSLNIGIVIDNHGTSRNAWYAFQMIEDHSHYAFVLECHINSAGIPPESFISDRNGGLIVAVRDKLLTTEHFFCIHHLDGNIDQNLARLITGENWVRFKLAFWDVYRAVSPEEFDKKWNKLTSNYPAAANYLNEELYPSRRQWAWAYTSFKFTCGIRTNGRVEGENRVNKLIGGPKKSLKNLFDGLNERTCGQSVQQLEKVRNDQRRQLPQRIESVFPGPLALLREFVGPHALHTCYQQMEASVYYKAELIQRPEGVKDWEEYAIQVSNEVGYTWEEREELNMMNNFANDKAHISTKFLLRLIRGRGLRVKHLIRVTCIGKPSLHIVAILDDDNYICDCCMGMNLGIPCRHYFHVLSVLPNFLFNMGVVRPRWYQNPKLDLANIPSVPAKEAEYHRPEADLPVSSKLPVITSNPLAAVAPRSSGPPASQTVPSRTAFQELNAGIRSLLPGIQTQEQLDFVIDRMTQIRSEQQGLANEGDFQEPGVLNPRGRPRSQRITGATEGRPRGGGARRGVNSRKCGICREVGHTRATCPVLQNNRALSDVDDG